MLPLNAACVVRYAFGMFTVVMIFSKRFSSKVFELMCGFLISTFLIYTIVHLPAKPSRESLKKMRGPWFESIDASIAAFVG